MQNIRLCSLFPVSSDPSTIERIFSALHAHPRCSLPQFFIAHTSQRDGGRKTNTSLVPQGSPVITPYNHPHPCDTHSCCASHLQTSEGRYTHSPIHLPQISMLCLSPDVTERTVNLGQRRCVLFS